MKQLSAFLSRRHLGLALISGSVLSLQVTFTRIFSITIWYHFTYLIVGVALLGGGAAGTYLAVRQWDKATLQRRIGKLAVLFSLSIIVSLLIVSFVKFDPLSRDQWRATAVGIVLYFVSLFGCFFFGGLTVAGIFSLWAKEAHRLYFADLLGASAGTLLIVLGIQAFTAPGALLLIALLALISGWVLDPQLSPNWKRGIALGGVVQLALLIVIAFVSPIQLPVPTSKELGRIIEAGEIGLPELVRWNPVARVDVLPEVTLDVPPVVGGLSSKYAEELLASEDAGDYPVRFVTLDGTSMTGIYEFDGDMSRFEILNHAVIAAPYAITVDNPSILNIGVGGGVDILLARLHDPESITAIDINGDLVTLLTDTYKDYSGALGDESNTHILTAEGRGFLMRGDQKYDLIQGIGLDNFAALNGGAYVLSEAYIYTVDAFKLAIDRLTDQGVFSWTRSVTEQPREMLRLIGIAAEALRQLGVSDPASHIALIGNEDQTIATLLVKRDGFTPESTAALQAWADDNLFPVLHDPLQQLDTVYADYLFAPDPRAFEASYPYYIYPVTDDNPYFYNYFRWTDLQFARGEQTGDINLRFPIGNIILLSMLGLSLLSAIAFIVYPLFRYQRKGLDTPQALPTLAYFSILGVSYIAVEVVLIQRFTLFIGYPTHAITTTIFSMLLFSAFGSLAAQRLCTTPQRLQMAVGVLVALIVVYVLALSPILSAFQQLDDPIRILLTIVLIAPLAFMMGMPFPTGIRQLSQSAERLVPWAWGVNGVFSVVGSVLVILISMWTNFTTALIVTAVLYGLAGLLAAALWRVKVVQEIPAGVVLET